MSHNSDGRQNQSQEVIKNSGDHRRPQKTCTTKNYDVNLPSGSSHKRLRTFDDDEYVPEDRMNSQEEAGLTFKRPRRAIETNYHWDDNDHLDGYKEDEVHQETGSELGSYDQETLSARTGRRKDKNKSNFGEDHEKPAGEEVKALRKGDKKILKGADPNHWVLEEEAAFEALQALEELTIIPSFGSCYLKDLDLSTLIGDTFEAKLGSIPVYCIHQPPRDSIAYGGCVVLSFLDLYWSPLLGCVVSPQRQSIMLYKELECHIKGYRKLENHDPYRLLEHITNSFNIDRTENLPIFYKRCQNLVLHHPVPGLSPPEKRYQCSRCGLWYMRHQVHVIFSPGCTETDSKREFSIPLYPPPTVVGTRSNGTHYRVKLAIPDHRTFASVVKESKSPRPRAEVEQQPVAFTTPTEEDTKDIVLIQSWLKSSFANRKGPSAPKLLEDNNGFRFSLANRPIYCLHSRHPPNSGSEVYTGCAVLSFFQLFFSPILGAIVSPCKKTLLCKQTLVKVLQSRVSGINSQMLLDHLNQSFRLLDEAEYMFKEIHRFLQLDKTIPGLEEPKAVYQCKDCGSYFDATQSAINNHQTRHHPINSKITVTKTYAIRLWNANTKAGYHAAMSQSWINLQETTSNQKPTRVQSLFYSDKYAIHLNGSGFREHFKSWNADLLTVIDLVALCSAEKSWTINGLSWKTERCIVQIHRLVRVYLSEAEQRVENSPFLRRAVTGLHRPIVTKFNPIQKDSLTSHCGYLTKLFALVLRYLAAHLWKYQLQGLDQTRCRHIVKQLGMFHPLISPHQLLILKTFLMKVHKSTTAPSDADVLVFIHDFLVDIFDNVYPVTEEISSVLEQTIIVLCLSGNMAEMWRSASHMYGVITTYFRIAKWTLVHAAVLGGKDAKYKQLPSVSISEGVAGVLEDEGPWMEDDLCLDKATVAEIFSEGCGEEPRIDDGGMEETPCTSTINNLCALSRLVDPKDITCLYGRLFRIRESAQCIARSEPFSSRVTWRDSDTTVALSWAFMKERLFSISHIQCATFHEVEKLNQACRQLFPVDLWDRSLSSLSNTSFIDNWGTASMFECPQNASLVAPIIAELHAHLIEAIKSGTDSLLSVLERPQKFLQHFAVVLYLTTGIPPYAHQAVMLRHMADDISDRNFMLMNGHGVFVWRASLGGTTGYRSKGSDSVWHIPSQATLPLILYLGIFRPVEIELLAADALKTKAGVNIALLTTRIFCNPLKRRTTNSIAWSTDYLDGILKTGPLAMEAFPHRLLFSAILERKHAQLLRTVQQPSVLDRQGQHTLSTGMGHYAVLQLQHSTGFHFSGYSKQLLACQELHSSCFLVKPTTGQKPVVSTLTQAKAPGDLNAIIHRNQSYALNVARNAITRAYGIASSSPDRAAVISRAKYSKITALSIILDKVQMHLGQDEFLPIINSLTYGVPIDEVESVLTDQGSVVRLTASAATLVLAALSEWFSGKLKAYSGGVSLFFGKWKGLVDDFIAEILLVVEQELPTWEAYMHMIKVGPGVVGEGENSSEIPLPSM